MAKLTPTAAPTAASVPFGPIVTAARAGVATSSGTVHPTCAGVNSMRSSSRAIAKGTHAARAKTTWWWPPAPGPGGERKGWAKAVSG